MTKWWFLSIFILLIGAFWIVFTAPDASQINDWQASAPAVGFTAPDFTLTTALGEQIQLSELRGEPVVINFWASWCGPCRAEMPALQAVSERYQANGLTILGVNATAGDSVAKAIDFVALNGLTFPILFDHENSVNAVYRVRSLPTTFFVDADGRIDDIVVGGPMSEALLQTRIDQLYQTEQ